MIHSNPEYESSPNTHENDTFAFADKFRELLPEIEFEESPEMLEARIAVIEALRGNKQDPDFLQSVWIEYAKICEEAIDAKEQTNAKTRAELQIAGLVHKALIFREVGDTRRYVEDLSDAEEYAYNMYFDKIVEAIGIELDNFAS